MTAKPPSHSGIGSWMQPSCSSSGTAWLLLTPNTHVDGMVCFPVFYSSLPDIGAGFRPVEAQDFYAAEKGLKLDESPEEVIEYIGTLNDEDIDIKMTQEMLATVSGGKDLRRKDGSKGDAGERG